LSDKSSVDFLRRLKLASPIRIIKPLIDNGSQFTDRYTTKDSKPSGQHAFDKVCTAMGIEHRHANHKRTAWLNASTDASAKSSVRHDSGLRQNSHRRCKAI
jgi:hypothetical protein